MVAERRDQCLCLAKLVLLRERQVRDIVQLADIPRGLESGATQLLLVERRIREQVLYLLPITLPVDRELFLDRARLDCRVIHHEAWR